MLKILDLQKIKRYSSVEVRKLTKQSLCVVLVPLCLIYWDRRQKLTNLHNYPLFLVTNCKIYKISHMTPGVRLPHYSDIFSDLAIGQPEVNGLTYVLGERYLGPVTYDQQKKECLRLMWWMMNSLWRIWKSGNSHLSPHFPPVLVFRKKQQKQSLSRKKVGLKVWLVTESKKACCFICLGT